jgi:hypothetical protein
VIAAPINDTCRSCGTAIVWLPNERTNKMAPIEAESRVDGNVVLLRLVGDLQRLTSAEDADAYRVLSKADRARWDADPAQYASIPRYVSHFAGCKDAPRWRGRESARGVP